MGKFNIIVVSIRNSSPPFPATAFDVLVIFGDPASTNVIGGELARRVTSK
jgi:hypothetical protein